ncbi:hypothetical protein Cgig2_028481 [Carnegiea gigantea]|uniref:Uncharacterized protein n=1 Tax=Carnegiea gigantea TaxID=171969 RepID=A0A9Q1GIP7_9CARY|nr:hypothetical protein Cgig2_028481 [Carnegiea gigantea]
MNQDSLDNGASHFQLNHQWVIVRRGKVRALASIECHCRDRDTAPLYDRKNRLRSLQLSLTGEPGNALRIPACNGGYYFCGALLLSSLWGCGLTFLAKESWSPLQEAVDLSLVSQLMKGLPQLPTLGSGVPFLFREDCEYAPWPSDAQECAAFPRLRGLPVFALLSCGAFTPMDRSRLPSRDCPSFPGRAISLTSSLRRSEHPLCCPPCALSCRLPATNTRREKERMPATMATNAIAAASAAQGGQRTLLITGVSRGLGRALALEVTKRGHRVVGCGRSQDKLDSLHAELQNSRSSSSDNNDSPHLLLNVDVRSNTSVEELAKFQIHNQTLIVESHQVGVVSDVVA